MVKRIFLCYLMILVFIAIPVQAQKAFSVYIYNMVYLEDVLGSDFIKEFGFALNSSYDYKTVLSPRIAADVGVYISSKPVKDHSSTLLTLSFTIFPNAVNYFAGTEVIAINELSKKKRAKYLVKLLREHHRTYYEKAVEILNKIKNSV